MDEELHLSLKLRSIRSSFLVELYENGFLKNFTKYIGKHLYQIPLPNNLQA